MKGRNERADLSGNALNSVLVTEHLSYSLPYRALFSQYMRPETATRLIDALNSGVPVQERDLNYMPIHSAVRF